MNRLTNLTPAEKKFLDDDIVAAKRASGKELSQPVRHIIADNARAEMVREANDDSQGAMQVVEKRKSTG
ncbi:hypothetical protein FKC81_28125, partial [Klebsiella pneumoniae]|uniref:hypothetical protein n=1 Tax=Klebsiella pneumoniae TaxID=573 RepID=UPI0011431BF4